MGPAGPTGATGPQGPKGDGSTPSDVIPIPITMGVPFAGISPLYSRGDHIHLLTTTFVNNWWCQLDNQFFTGTTVMYCRFWGSFIYVYDGNIITNMPMDQGRDYHVGTINPQYIPEQYNPFHAMSVFIDQTGEYCGIFCTDVRYNNEIMFRPSMTVGQNMILRNAGYMYVM
jgi:hypothetical protein